MVKLNKNELLAIKGGGLSFGAACLIDGGIIFLIGVNDCYFSPLKCNG